MIQKLLKKLASPFRNWDFYLIGFMGGLITTLILTYYVPDNFNPWKFLIVFAGSFIYAYLRILIFPNFNKSKNNEIKNS